jgi:hypothetical protein
MQPAPSLGTLIASRIVDIQQRHHAETGRWIDLQQAFVILQREEADPIPEPTVPPSRHDLLRVQAWLAEQWYDPKAIRWAIADLERWGTAELSPWIDPEDRPTVEAMLRPDPAWNEPAWRTERVRVCESSLN